MGGDMSARDAIWEDFATLLTGARAGRGWSRAKLARELAVSEGTIYKWEREGQWPSGALEGGPTRPYRCLDTGVDARHTVGRTGETPSALSRLIDMPISSV